MNGAAPLAPDEALVDQALALIATADFATARAAPRAQARLQAWRARTAEHEAAYTEALRRWQLLAQLGPDMRERFDAPTDTAGVRHRHARRVLLGLGLAGGCTAWLGWQAYWRQPLYQAAHHTGVAQLTRVQVPDDGAGGAGSWIELAAQTRLTVALYRGERVVTLEHGQACFTVVPDRQRPFRVQTRGGTVEVVGTIFDVDDRGGPVSVAVQQGHVRFYATPRAASWFGLGAGQRIDLLAGSAAQWRAGQVQTRRDIDSPSIAAWRQGWLGFDNQRLDEALPTINAYRRQPLRLSHPSVAALRLTGRFRSDQVQDLPDLLETILPVRAQPQPDGSVVLQPR